MHSQDNGSKLPTGFQQKGLEKLQWFFNISRPKSQITMIMLNIMNRKTKSTTSDIGPPYYRLQPCWLTIFYNLKVVHGLRNSISLYNAIYIHTHIFGQFFCIWFKIQWAFHERLIQISMIFPLYFFILTNFKYFSWSSMIFPYSSCRSEFQWFFKSCRDPVPICLVLQSKNMWQTKENQHIVTKNLISFEGGQDT